jgi:hypothetical protein
MKTVLQIIEETGGLDTFTWTRIENPPFMALVIEALGERGPNGHRALSIAHYGDQNGDAMRDPEIFAEIVIENGAARLWPFYFRNDYAGVERWTRQQEADGSMTCRLRETQDLESFMEMWDANIQHQGFLEAFQRTAGQRC